MSNTIRTPGAPSSTTPLCQDNSLPSYVNVEALPSETQSSGNALLPDPMAEAEADTAIQDGVAEVEAVTTIWTRRDLIIAYTMIWLIYFIDTLQQSTTGNLLAWVTSDFAAHSLIATTAVVSLLFGGLSKLTLAKVLDIWGRPQGYLVSVVILTIGLIMMAACTGVKLYAVGQVFYWTGYNGLSYSLTIFIADTSALKNRSLMFAFSLSPYLITTWIGGSIADAFLKGPGWRWAYGSFSIITPIVTMPLFFVMWKGREKAKAAGLIKLRSSGRTWTQNIKYYIYEFDVVGLILITAGLALFLLPFNIYQRQEHGWRTPFIIIMLLVSVVLIVAFGVYETFYAPVKYLPYELFTDRTIVGSFCLSTILFICFYVWNSYFSSFLQVVNDLDIVHTNYVSNIYTVGSCLWAIVTGIIIRRTGRFKALALYFGVPFTILGVALMIRFRQPGVYLGYVCMCQILIAFAGGTLGIASEIAVMAVVSHQHIAVVLAVLAMCSSIGGAIGSTIASAIWQGVFPTHLLRYLPADHKKDLAEIVGSIAVQKSYAVGTPVRIAIEKAYGDAQRIMLIASSVILTGAIVCVTVWRDYNVKERKQVTGTVV
ncbi:hypothetical protein TD95_001666 [Thielaviopsis punctulata]|uniref:Major facilitator superfamily (MFS) profile domain-containing protein n=1 Tax=Thielaviopsis punctulata TaxID=72032 RepID=A0A0F4ZH57_9PEZI|nr:hypothetical protein TD95_001666 [Thielaviopsis punctulata]